jgi:hypothetical protein
MDIINHTTKDVCKLKYFPYSYFSKDVPRKVTGVVTDVNGQARWVLTGKMKYSFFSPHLLSYSLRYMDGKNRRWTRRIHIRSSCTFASYGNP